MTIKPVPRRPALEIKKLTIGSLDDQDKTIQAQYNPKELQVTQTAPWKLHEKQGKEAGEVAHLEYGNAQPRTLQVELLFDAVETHGNLDIVRGHTVADAIGILEALTSVRDEKAANEDWRPHVCVITWGVGGMPPITCVIEQLQTKYQVLAPSGRVLRATCTINLKEASRVDKGKTRRSEDLAKRWDVERGRVASFERDNSYAYGDYASDRKTAAWLKKY